MTGQTTPPAPVHRWYARPVFFVTDLPRASSFDTEGLGFKKNWHSEEGSGTVCQVSCSDCEIVLCQDAKRCDKGCLFIELTAEGLRDLRRELAERSIPHKSTWGGYETMQVDDPDGNELFFPVPD